MEEQTTIESGFSLAVQTVQEWIADFYTLLPNIAAGFFLFLIFVLLALGAKISTRKFFARRRRIDLGHILSDLAFWSLR